MAIGNVKRQSGPGCPDDTLAAGLERITLEPIGVADLFDGLLRVDAFDDILVAVDQLNGPLHEQAVAARAFPKVQGRSAGVEGGIGCTPIQFF